jgi:hypothetical protein
MDNVKKTTTKFQIMPVSFNGFGPVAIFIMLLTVVVAELYKKNKERQRYKDRHQHH